MDWWKNIHWSSPPATDNRRLERVTSIDVAFADAWSSLVGITDSSIPAVFRARQLLSDSVAALPMQEVQGETVVNQTSELLLQPNPRETYRDTISKIMLSLLDHGNSYFAVTNWDDIGNPKAGYVCNPTEVAVSWDRKMIYAQYHWRDKLMDEGTDFLHISINKEAGSLLGRGPIDAARLTLLQTLAAEEVLAHSMARDNYTPNLVIRTPEAKTSTEAQTVLDTWMDTRDAGGPRGQGKKRPAVLGGGADIEQITFSPHDAEWIAGRNFHIQQVGRIFGLSGFFLLVDSGSSLTYSTTESTFRLFLNQTLRPTYLENIEQQFSRLLPSGRKSKFNADEILRADQLARYQANSTALGGAAFKVVNEVRAEEGLSAIPGGDELIAVSTQAKEPAALLNGGPVR